MKKVGFIGGYDKTDLILYIAKIMTVLKQKVLVVDTTITQKSRYIVPAMAPTLKYITTFEDIDIACGFTDLEDLKHYIGIPEEQELDYDLVLVDTDNLESFESYGLEGANNNYFVTAFDNYSLKKGLEVLSGLKRPIHLTKVLFSVDVSQEEDDYLNYLALGYKIDWNDYKVYFPIDIEDFEAINNNQRASKISFRNLTIPYKDSLTYIANEILGESNDSKVRKAVKIIERGV